MQRQPIKVWDPLVRLLHWSLVVLFTSNALFTDPESRTHRMVGFMIVGLLALRLFWGLAGTEYARFSSFPPSPRAAIGQVREMLGWQSRAHAGHSPLGALMIYNLILTIGLIALSGWMMTTNRWFGIEWVEELHEAAVTWAEISVVAHIAAVFVESLRLRINLPKSMVTGYKTMNGQDRH